MAQTPSPLQEWQYSGGVILARLFQPDLPDWRLIAGAAAEVAPIYDGSRAMKVTGGPVFNVYHKDEWYVSTGEGIGYNFIRGKQYQIGLGLAYDQGRSDKDDGATLRGMGDIYAAPVAKLYASVVLSKKFPMILRVAARQYIGGGPGCSRGCLRLRTAARQFEDLCHVCRPVHYDGNGALQASCLRRR